MTVGEPTVWRGQRWILPFWCKVARRTDPQAMCSPRAHMEATSHMGKLGFPASLRCWAMWAIGFFIFWACNNST
ncbi:hypothetical protein ES332_A02G158600v1 [Gossypium tomentosum]|uniref:Uncharacterized protein n=1 Tax=Gossypium tomentosum TaxID=34277 RepID=A0A5D2RKN8_GOSTO|nr:hypothetical protein ES332_A02G158600v1 [Gossypium tomentosum]